LVGGAGSSGLQIARELRKKGDLVIGTRWRDLARLGIQVRPRLDAVDLTTALFAHGRRPAPVEDST
jgi:NAD(P)-dependent dehydrogenase (short-subunit alcohol dehydrogenase family)